MSTIAQVRLFLSFAVAIWVLHLFLLDLRQLKPSPPSSNIDIIDPSFFNTSFQQQRQQPQSHHHHRHNDIRRTNIEGPKPSTQMFLQSSSSLRKLVAVTALGHNATVPLVVHNVNSHFADWDCIIYVYVKEDVIPSVSPLQTSTHCSIVRIPGTMWGHFLMSLTPELTGSYDYVAVLLDDVYIPSTGRNAVNISQLVTQMQQYDLSSTSPSIRGSFWPSTKYNPTTTTSTATSNNECLWRTPNIETFVQIFARDVFDCWLSQFHYSNPQGSCVDLCFTKICPNARLAVDSRMVAYHLGYVTFDIPSDALPERTIGNTKDTTSTTTGNIIDDLRALQNVRKGRTKPKTTLNFELCKKQSCNRDRAAMAKESRTISLECRK